MIDANEPACTPRCGEPVYFFRTRDDGTEEQTLSHYHHVEDCPRAKWIVDLVKAGRADKARPAMAADRERFAALAAAR